MRSDNRTKTARSVGAVAAACALWALAMALMGAGFYFFFSSRAVPTATDWGFRGYPAVMALPFATVGAVVAARRPRNPIGWMFCLIGIISACQMVAEEYGVYASLSESSRAAGRTADWLGHWLWLPGAGLVSVSALLFPTGKVASGRWRPALWVAVAGTIAGVFGFGLSSPGDMGLSGENPLEIEALGAATDVATVAGLGLLFVSLVLATASVIVRMRRSIGDERQQMKWLVFGVALLPLGNLVASLPAVPELVQNVGVCGLALFPVAVGVAVLKYRLYEIDVVINRTLVYGTLTAVLAMTYLGAVVLLREALGGFTEGSNIAIAASTLAVAGLFSPLRARIQTFIDHRFYRSRYDATTTLGDFTSRLRDQLDLDALTSELTQVVATTMHPSHVSVWLRSEESST